MTSDASDDDLPEAPLAGGRLARLNKYLADHGVASRRRCDELIVGGKVSVDGEIVTQLGTKIDPEKNQVEIDGVVLAPETTRPRYYLLNKPRGVLCTNERRESRPRAIDLIDDPDKGRIYTVGRLDEESTGLILLTNDGEFANRIAHPRYGVSKTYLVKLRGRVEAEPLAEIRRGVHLAEGRTGRTFLKVLKRTTEFSLVTITLHEGKNREVRRVFAHVGFKVQHLRRTHLGPLSDRTLKEGRWRPLRRTEVEELLAASREGASPASDKREDPRTRYFAARGPGPERRSPSNQKWNRDRKRQQESSTPPGRRQRGEHRKQLRGQPGKRERR